MYGGGFDQRWSDMYSEKPHRLMSGPRHSSNSSAPEVRHGPSKIVLRSRALVQSRTCTAITFILTIYALIGDDVRTIAWEQPADDWFNVITLTTIVIFAVEVALSCIGKEDYFLSFFCLLDVVSTSTLLLDLTWISALLRTDEEDLDNLRGSRTAKLGARAGRVVRVLRLVRILKLYKAVHDVRSDRRMKKKRGADADGKATAVKPGAEDEWDNIDGEEKALFEQSQVGKELSSLTIRRVICLVLLMMLILPILRVDNTQQVPASSYYAADLVYQAYQRMVNATGISGVSGVVQTQRSADRARRAYERALLRLVYHHNWYTSHTDCPYSTGICSNMFYQHVFWVGVASRDPEALQRHAQLMRVRPEAVKEWEASIDKKENFYTYGAMPQKVQEVLGSSWSASCLNDRGLGRLGFSLLPEVDGKEPPFVPNSYEVKCPDDLRSNEILAYTPRLVSFRQSQDWRLVFYFDMRPFTKSESMYAIINTCFVCLSLTSAALFFVNDANSLVLSPVESMINRVEIIRKNPLRAIKMADEEFKHEEAKRCKDRKSGRLQAWWNIICCNGQQRQELMETVVLERTIVKLGSLLALGFGEAGASIIGSNLSGAESACVNAMVSGQMVDCIIGCMRINDFGAATEVLQGKIMTFVNQIAEIVHGVVDEFHGAVNKNQGDTFLAIWRTWDLEDHKVVKLADMSMVAVSRILAAIHRSPILAGYRTHPGLQNRILTNCRVRLTTGLHFGWAIEGAVGSEFKIDASYLSPNVSLAEALERLTGLYGVNVLVSEAVVAICTQGMASQCRLIDHVKLGAICMELYCIDLDYDRLTVDEEGYRRAWNNRERFKARQFLEMEKQLKWIDDISIVDFFTANTDIYTMRDTFSMDFLHIFNVGFQNYAQGEWQVAARTLHRTSSMLGKKDGPSLELLRFMERWQYEVPEGWFGIREIQRHELSS